LKSWEQNGDYQTTIDGIDDRKECKGTKNKTLDGLLVLCTNESNKEEHD
jgi:hypothetical protein